LVLCLCFPARSRNFFHKKRRKGNEEKGVVTTGSGGFFTCGRDAWGRGKRGPDYPHHRDYDGGGGYDGHGGDSLLFLYRGKVENSSASKGLAFLKVRLFLFCYLLIFTLAGLITLSFNRYPF